MRVRLSIVKNRLVIEKDEELFASFDVCMVWDLLKAGMSRHSSNPGVARRAKKLQKYYENDVIPGPFEA